MRRQYDEMTLTDSRTDPLRNPVVSPEAHPFATWPAKQSFESVDVQQRHSAVRRWLPRFVAAMVICMSLLPIVVFGQVYRHARANVAHQADAIVVLGAAQFNGVPSQVFRARLDTAYDLYREGYAPLIVVTGGRIYGDQYTEAESGRNYLTDRGVPADAILMENISHNTAASFEGVQKLLQPRGVHSLLIVSDGFHLYRSEMLARDAGFDAYGFAAQASPIRHGSATELRYMVRETFGVLAWKLHLKR